MTKTSTVIERKLYEFIDVLRDANISISTDEVLSLFNALEHISIIDKAVFKNTLRTTLIKDFTDIPIYDRCFDEFFGNLESLDEDQTVLTDMPTDSDGNDLRELEQSLDGFIDDLSHDNILEKDAEEVLQLFLDDLQESGSGGGLGMMLFNARSGTIQSYSSKGSHGNGEEDGLENLTDRLLNMIEQRLSKKKIGARLHDREEYLLNKFIYQITPEEVKEMRELIKRFGQKLKNRVSLRKKRVKHGGIDIKKTFRSSLQFGGIPFRLFYKNRKIDRPQLVVMCDISGSVNQYSRFMLLLTYTLQSLFSKVRTFAFISNMVEITPLFREMDPERALNSIFSDTNFTYGWGSNYGRCFEQFVRDYSDSLTSKTTVLIIGDGRNNNQAPGLDALIKIKERTRNLFWLNPDKKHLWNWSDSIAYLYEEYCDEMREVNNFLDLSEFIDKLFVDR